MASKFPSPAQDYAHSRISFDELCGTSKASVYLVTAKGRAIMAGIHPGATLVVDRALTAVDGSVILVAVDGEYVVRRLRLVPVRCLEYLDWSGLGTPVALAEVKSVDSNTGKFDFFFLIIPENDQEPFERFKSEMVVKQSGGAFLFATNGEKAEITVPVTSEKLRSTLEMALRSRKKVGLHD